MTQSVVGLRFKDTVKWKLVLHCSHVQHDMHRGYLGYLLIVITGSLWKLDSFYTESGFHIFKCPVFLDTLHLYNFYFYILNLHMYQATFS
jgi:hypothetical protein